MAAGIAALVIVISARTPKKPRFMTSPFKAPAPASGGSGA
jgi:hypothetical protein